MNPASFAAKFRRSLLAWYRLQGRDLPWRRTRDPYAILVSEFMLQQTQVAAVVPYYNEWMRRFPDFAALARASEEEVLHGWQGLGYYARARNLRATAQVVIQKYRGCFPRSPEAIQNLPGIGRYTANAVATFAFNQAVSIVEANIARLLARLIDLQIPIDSSAGRSALWTCAATLLPNRDAALYNSALMDLGALICGARPKCEVCPVKKFCGAKLPTLLPLKKARPALKLCAEHHGFVLRRSRVLLEQSQDRWRGMWTLPRLQKQSSARKPLHVSEFPYTNHRITLSVFAHCLAGRRRGTFQRWFPIDRLDSIPLPSPHRRALKILISARPQTLCDLTTQT
ncbi:MAG TPA: A/G-specific adenine glycosylase [Chthoniobacterales bacterium]